MKKITLGTKITLTIAGLLAFAGVFYAANPSVFPVTGDPGNGHIGVAAAPAALLVTEYTSGNIDSIDCAGNVSVLATIQSPSGGLERYVTIAPSQSATAGFTPRDVFVTQGTDVYKLSGSSVTPFANISGCSADHTGITFDHVGTFGYNMIVTCNGGGVWEVNSTGNPTLIADVSTSVGGLSIEGPAVVPLSFGPLGGQILVADENNGQVHAIASNGTVTPEVFDWPGAEGVIVIPSAQCTFCSGGTSFFQVAVDGTIYQYPPTDFTALGGDILVTSESGSGTAVMSFDGAQYNTGVFDSSISGAVLEGSSWVDCDVPPPTASPTPTPQPSPTPAATNLAVSAATGTYGGTTTFTATLTSASGNTALGGKTITFTLNGNSAGSGVTDATGVATSSAVLLVGSAYNAGTYPAGAAASFAGDSSFGPSSGTNSLTINRATLTVSADSKARMYGAPNPPLTASYTGFVNGETLGSTSGVTGTPNLTTTADQFSAVGNYPITITQGTLNPGNNYTFTFNNGTLTVFLCGGIIGLNSITIGASSALVDSYNSSTGYPASQSNQASLFSNGTITLQGAKLYGEAVSDGGNVVLQAGSLVTGDVAYSTTLSNSGTVQGSIDHQQTSTPLVLPIPAACGVYTAAPTSGNMWITGTYSYSAATGNLTVSGGGTATLANGSYCFHNVTVSGGSTLRVNGAVMISVTGQFNTTGGSIQNTTNIPANLQVTSSYTGNNGVTVSGGSAAFLSIYAPGTSVTVSGGGPLFGSLVGKTLTVTGNSSIHEDLGLPCWP